MDNDMMVANGDRQISAYYITTQCASTWDFNIHKYFFCLLGIDDACVTLLCQFVCLSDYVNDFSEIYSAIANIKINLIKVLKSVFIFSFVNTRSWILYSVAGKGESDGAILTSWVIAHGFWGTTDYRNGGFPFYPWYQYKMFKLGTGGHCEISSLKTFWNKVFLLEFFRLVMTWPK